MIKFFVILLVAVSAHIHVPVKRHQQNSRLLQETGTNPSLGNEEAYWVYGIQIEWNGCPRYLAIDVGTPWLWQQAYQLDNGAPGVNCPDCCIQDEFWWNYWSGGVQLTSVSWSNFELGCEEVEDLPGLVAETICLIPPYYPSCDVSGYMGLAMPPQQLYFYPPDIEIRRLIPKGYMPPMKPRSNWLLKHLKQQGMISREVFALGLDLECDYGILSFGTYDNSEPITWFPATYNYEWTMWVENIATLPYSGSMSFNSGMGQYPVNLTLAIDYSILPCSWWDQIKCALNTASAGCTYDSNAVSWCTASVSYSDLPPIEFTWYERTQQHSVIYAPEAYYQEVNGGSCYKFMIAMGPEEYIVLGSSFLAQYYSIFDAENSRIGFAIPNPDTEVYASQITKCSSQSNNYFVKSVGTVVGSQDSLNLLMYGAIVLLMITAVYLSVKLSKKKSYSTIAEGQKNTQVNQTEVN